MTFEDFETQLQELLVIELTHWRSSLSDEIMRAFDFGCHPWHGYIEPSFLTINEDAEFPPAQIWSTVGDWRLYDFTLNSPGRMRFAALGQWMQRQWSAGKDPVAQGAIADQFFTIFASVLMSRSVVNVLKAFNLAEDFQLGVIDSDHPKFRNFCRSWPSVLAEQ